jgi:hypothetical protein
MQDGVFQALKLDDGQIIDTHIHRRVDKNNPRLVVTLEKFLLE